MPSRTPFVHPATPYSKWLRLFLLLCLCPLFAPAQQTIVLVGGGSTVPLPLYKKWADAFNQGNRAVQMQYIPFGSAEGVTQVANGSSDFGAGEVLLTPEERDQKDLMELPAALIGIAPVYNLPSVTAELRFSGDLLAEIFMGNVKTWNDPRIARLNPGVSLPSRPIQVFYRPAGKGTNFVFTDFLSKTSPKFHEKIGRTASPRWPVGTPAERSSDMVDKVKSTEGSIGYVEVQYATERKITTGSVLNPAGRYVTASNRNIIAACQAVEGQDWDRFSVSLTNAPGADSYPIASFTWLYLRRKPTDPKRSAALRSLLSWMFTDGQRIALSEGYPELPTPLLAKITAKAGSIR
jgi:phosphate transport system substrate-binding protein